MIMKFWKDMHGATAIEYGLITAVVSVGAITGYRAVGAGLLDNLLEIAAALGG